MDVNHGEKIKGLGCTTSQLDVASEESIHKFKEQYGDRPLDLLLNVAGMTTNPHYRKRESNGENAGMVTYKAPPQELRIRTTTHSPP